MSATLTVRCPQCAKESRVPATAAGKHGRCGQCNHRFLIELSATAAEPADLPADEYDLAPLESKLIPEAHRPPPTPLPASAGMPGRLPQTAKPKDQPHKPAAKWIPAVVGGVAAALVCAVTVGVAIWALTRPGGPAAAQANAAVGNRAANGAPAAGGAPAAVANGAAGPGVADIRRDPKPGSQFWIAAHPLASADPATWKVTAEDEIDLASGLHSVFPLNTKYPPTHFFSAPQAAQVATVHRVEDPSHPESSGLLRFEWMRHDLRTGQTLGKLPTSLTLSEYQLALSPSGKQLAVAFYYPSGQLEIWSDDGSRVAAIALGEITAETRPKRLRFLSESRILIDVAGSVIAYDLPTGAEAFKIEAGFVVSPVLSWGRQWLAGYTGDGIAWFSAVDGSPAGRIDFGEHWLLEAEAVPMEGFDWGLAFHPSGKSVAVLALGKGTYETLVAHYDLASGRVLEQFVLPALNYERRQGAYWCGDRQLLLVTGHVIDFDRKTWLGRYGERVRFCTQPPDQRCWQLLWPIQSQSLDPRLGLADDVKCALVASTVLDAELKRRRDEWQDSMIWGPDFAVALGTDDVIKDERRPQVLAALADVLTERGFRVDPAARHRLLVKEARALSAPDVTRPGEYRYIAELKLELVDSRGQTISRPGAGQIGGTGEGGYDEAWAFLCEKIKTLEPLPMKWRQPDGWLADPHQQRQLAIDGVAPKAK
jgi:hypothetical protein